jgi:hypothetical protein
VNCTFLNQYNRFVPSRKTCILVPRIEIPQLQSFQSLELNFHPSFGPCLAVLVRERCVFRIIANLWRGSRIGSALTSVIPPRGCANPSARQVRPGEKMRSVRGFSCSGECLQTAMLSAENCFAAWMALLFRGGTACLVSQLRRRPELLTTNNLGRLNGLLLAG